MAQGTPPAPDLPTGGGWKNDDYWAFADCYMNWEVAMAVADTAATAQRVAQSLSGG